MAVQPVKKLTGLVSQSLWLNKALYTRCGVLHALSCSRAPVLVSLTVSRRVPDHYAALCVAGSGGAGWRARPRKGAPVFRPIWLFLRALWGRWILDHCSLRETAPGEQKTQVQTYKWPEYLCGSSDSFDLHPGRRYGNRRGVPPVGTHCLLVRCRGSGVEHPLGKGEVGSSNLPGSTILQRQWHYL